MYDSGKLANECLNRCKWKTDIRGLYIGGPDFYDTIDSVIDVNNNDDNTDDTNDDDGIVAGVKSFLFFMKCFKAGES